MVCDAAVRLPARAPGYTARRTTEAGIAATTGYAFGAVLAFVYFRRFATVA